MGKLIYATPLSLDGYVGNDDYSWSDPGEGGHEFFSGKTAPIGTFLYGRRMYDTMKCWENPEVYFPGADQDTIDFANVWKSANKIVYSNTLKEVTTTKTTLMRHFEPAAIMKLKESTEKDISISGATLAAQAFRAGVIDEIQLFVVPKMIGGGIAVFPRDIVIELELKEQTTFGAGWTYLRYEVKR